MIRVLLNRSATAREYSRTVHPQTLHFLPTVFSLKYIPVSKLRYDSRGEHLQPYVLVVVGMACTLHTLQRLASSSPLFETVRVLCKTHKEHWVISIGDLIAPYRKHFPRRGNAGTPLSIARTTLYIVYSIRTTLWIENVAVTICTERQHGHVCTR